MKSSASVSLNRGNLRSAPRTQKPSRFSRLTRWWPMKPPAPHTSAAFAIIGFEDISLAPSYFVIRCTHFGQCGRLNAGEPGLGHATALRVKRTSPEVAANRAARRERDAVSCRRRKHRAVKKDRNRGSHHFEQNLSSSRPIQPLERAHQIGKWAGQDANVPPFDEAGIQPRQVAVRVLDQRFDDTGRNGNWPTILIGQ